MAPADVLPQAEGAAARGADTGGVGKRPAPPANAG